MTTMREADEVEGAVSYHDLGDSVRTDSTTSMMPSLEIAARARSSTSDAWVASGNTSTRPMPLEQ